jgi:hypothetical protein
VNGMGEQFLFLEHASMSVSNGSIELACIQAISHAEAHGGRALMQQERKFFKIGFLAGAMHGLEVAKTQMNEVAEEKPRGDH